jgi:hypothetical protein
MRNKDEEQHMTNENRDVSSAVKTDDEDKVRSYVVDFPKMK